VRPGDGAAGDAMLLEQQRELILIQSARKTEGSLRTDCLPRVLKHV
jgi:hypothetical protein